LADYCDSTTVYVDDLAAIVDHGPVSHLIFAAGRKTPGEDPERRVMVRLIIPNELRTPMGRQLIASTPIGASADLSTELSDVVLH
jgi:hypothetical protein